MDTLRQDFRYALRRLARSPAFALTIVLTLALGIGANTAIFSVVNAVLLRPLPFAQPDELVNLNHVYTGSDGEAFEASVSARGFREYETVLRTFDDMAAYTGWSANLTGVGEPERVQAARVTATYFRVFGVTPALGRDFREGEDAGGGSRVAVVSHGFWTRQLGGDPNAVGTILRLNGEAFEVVGVMPVGFLDVYNPQIEIWAPLSFTPAQETGGWTNEFLRVVGRLNDGVTVAGANEELSVVSAQLRDSYPDDLPPVWSVRARGLADLSRANVRPALLVLLGAVGLVLLIACANVANLLLARASTRSKEVAIRTALGAGRQRIARQLLTESVVLGLAGGTLGVLLAIWGVRILSTALPAGMRLAIDVGLDGSVLAFAAVLAIGTGLLFGAAPALQLVRTDVQHTLREGGRSGRADRAGSWLRRGLVAGEIALALTLLAGAGLLLRSFARIQAVDPGFRADHVMTFNVYLPPAEYTDADARRTFFDRALAAVREVPGVVDAGLINVPPFGGGWATSSFSIEGLAIGPGEQSPWGDSRAVSPGYFETMAIPLREGRTFTVDDGPATTPVMVVDAELADRYWPDGSALGRRITFGDPSDPETVWYQIVGVVGHAAHEGLDADPRVQYYRTYRQATQSSFTFMLRTSVPPTSVVPAARAAIQSIDADMPLALVRDMETMIEDSVGQRRLSTLLLGGFAALALLLACLGIYGVMSYVVAQKRQEIGVRMALGARAGEVVGLFLRQGASLVGAGLVLGLAGAFGLTRVLQSQLFGVDATDPATFGIVAIVLVATALAATAIPALRASRVDPLSALRDEG